MKLKSRVEFLNESLDDLFTNVHRGSYNCSNKGLTSLLDLNIPNKVIKDFSCSINFLTSLEGAPNEVGGDFYCYRNKLKSLEGGPQEVDGYYDCSDNQLTSLEGCPQEVFGFNCSDNQLTSLEGHPKIIRGNFHLKGNPMITDKMIKDFKKNCDISGRIIIR